MTVLAEILKGLQKAVALSDRVDQLGRRCDGLMQEMVDLSHELRDCDRRITRLEAQWETAVQLSAIRRGPGRLEDKD